MPWADRILILDQHNRRLDDEENHFLFPAALSVLCFYDSLFHLHYLSPSVCVQMWPSGLLEWSPRVMRVSDLINWDVRRAQFTLVLHQPTSMYFLKNKKYFLLEGWIFPQCVCLSKDWGKVYYVEASMRRISSWSDDHRHSEAITKHHLHRHWHRISSLSS